MAQAQPCDRLGAHCSSCARCPEARFTATIERVVRCTLKIPFDKLALVALIREHGNVLAEEYEADGARVTVTVEREFYHRVESYVLPAAPQ